MLRASEDGLSLRAIRTRRQTRARGRATAAMTLGARVVAAVVRPPLARRRAGVATRSTRTRTRTTRKVAKRRLERDADADARRVAREANGRDADGETNADADADADADASIVVIENLDAATQEELETLYVACKERYFTGAPAVSDEYFDALEAKLSYAGSGVVKKYPRCSVRGKAVYSDCVVDEAQMRALQTSYLAILALGTLFALVDFGDDLRAVFSVVLGDHGPNVPQFRVPIVGLVGLGLISRGLEKLNAASTGETLAMTGECPACHEDVYAFLPVRRGQARERTECHVCGRKIVFETQFERRETSPWRVTGKGRIYLVSEIADFSVDKSADDDA